MFQVTAVGWKCICTDGLYCHVSLWWRNTVLTCTIYAHYAKKYTSEFDIKGGNIAFHRIIWNILKISLRLGNLWHHNRKRCISHPVIVIYNHYFELCSELSWKVYATCFAPLCILRRGEHCPPPPSKNPSVPKFRIATMLSCSYCSYYNLICTLFFSRSAFIFQYEAKVFFSLIPSVLVYLSISLH